MYPKYLSFGFSLLALGACSNDAPQAISSSDTLSGAALLSASCSGCHMKGNEALVDLSERSAEQIEVSVLAYKRDASGQTVMHRLARGYSETEIAEIAAFLAAEPTGERDE
jgi:cytochrome c553